MTSIMGKDNLPIGIEGKQKRLVLNRIAATRNRSRNKLYTENLEYHVCKLQDEMTLLHAAREQLHVVDDAIVLLMTARKGKPTIPTIPTEGHRSLAPKRARASIDSHDHGAALAVF